jgi:hypothetical protein
MSTGSGNSIPNYSSVLLAHIDQYCDSTCQKSHWLQHKVDCRSPLAKEAWEPDWVIEKRKPTFVDDRATITFGGKKYYWGNMPALDVLRLSDIEGASYKNDLHLLFAGGDNANSRVKRPSWLMYPTTSGELEKRCRNYL